MVHSPPRAWLLFATLPLLALSTALEWASVPAYTRDGMPTVMWAAQNTAPDCTLSVSGVWLNARSRLGLNLDLYSAVSESLPVGQRIDVRAMTRHSSSALPPKQEEEWAGDGKPTETVTTPPAVVPPSWFVQFVAVNKGLQPNIIMVENSTEKRTWEPVGSADGDDFAALYGAAPNIGLKNTNLSSTRWFWNRTTAQTPSYKIVYTKACSVSAPKLDDRLVRLEDVGFGSLEVGV